MKYKNLFFLALGIIAAVLLLSHQPFLDFLSQIGGLGYLGAFIGGVLFVFVFTAAIGAVIIGALASKLAILPLAIIAGLGALLGDYIIFRFVRSKALNEFRPLYKAIGGEKLTHLLHTKFFSWTLPVIGAIIIASPLPDELGVGLIGLTRMKTSSFALLSFGLNTIGFLIIIMVARLIS